MSYPRVFNYYGIYERYTWVTCHTGKMGFWCDQSTYFCQLFIELYHTLIPIAVLFQTNKKLLLLLFRIIGGKVSTLKVRTQGLIKVPFLRRRMRDRVWLPAKFTVKCSFPSCMLVNCLCVDLVCSRKLSTILF